MFKRLINDRKGQGFTEYALLVAGIALVGVVSVAIIGQKTGELLAAVATVLPGNDPASNGPIQTGAIVEYQNAGGGVPIAVDLPTILANQQTERTNSNLGFDDNGLSLDLGDLVREPSF